LVEHLTQKQVEDYCRQQLGGVELLLISDHMGECAPCRQQIEYAMNGDTAFFALRSDVFGDAVKIDSMPWVHAHLTTEQTAGYVDKNLSGEEFQMVADHLTHCELCALAVDDLYSFSQQIAPSLEHEYHPAPVPPATQGWWQQIIASLPGYFQRSPGLAFGTALAIFLVAVISWFIWQTPQKIEPKPEIVDLPPSPSPPPVEPVVAPVVAQLNDGKAALTLDQEGKLSGAEGLPPAYQNMLKEALIDQRIEKSSQLKGLARPSSSLMSTDKDKSEFSLVEPVAKVLMTNHPTFRWSPMEGATGYVVEVYDSQFNLVIASPQIASHSWASPQSLSRGNIYGWQVKAIKDGQEITSPRPPAPQARFRILDQAKANELAKARRAYASSHLTLGLLYAEAGLLKEAEQELRMLQKANPNSEIARRLLRQVQALRRRSE
jgi:hypothetical protein